MNVVVTGSLGHISKPLTQQVVQKGHVATVISSNPEKQAAMEALRATVVIGCLENSDFKIVSFTNAYEWHKSGTIGRVKVEDFVRKFAAAFLNT